MKRMLKMSQMKKVVGIFATALLVTGCMWMSDNTSTPSTEPSFASQTQHANQIVTPVSLSKKKKLAYKPNPDAANVNVRLGMGYLNKGDVQRAQMKFQSALQQAPDNPEVINAMAYFYSRTGQPSRAKELYQQAIKKHPNSGQAHNNFGVFLCQHDDKQQAVAHFLKATQDPNYLKTAEAFENAGLCALKMEEIGRAWQYFQFAHQRDPNRASVLMELAQLAYQQEKFAQAKRYLSAYEKIAGASAYSTQLSEHIQHQEQIITG